MDKNEKGGGHLVESKVDRQILILLDLKWDSEKR